MRKHLLLTGMLMSALAAHSSEMLVSGVVLSPGMSPAAVRKAAAKRGSAVTLQEYSAQAWFIADKGDPEHERGGALEFKDGKLLKITRTWKNSNDAEAHDAGAKLYALLVGIIPEGSSKAARVSAYTLRNPGNETKIIELQIGKKKVTIYTPSDDGQKGRLQIDETLE